MASRTAWRRLVRHRQLAQQPYRCLSCSLRLQRQQPTEFDQTKSSSPASNEPTTHFGYQTVAESMKEAKVGAVFSSVASTYDTMNDLMSLGIHRLWKDYFVRSLDPGVKRISQSSSNPAPTSSSPSPSTNSAQQPQEEDGWNILDVAGGTGDIAFRMLDHATLMYGDHRTRVTVADINEDMLAEGRKRSMHHTSTTSSLFSSSPNPSPPSGPAWSPTRLTFLHANAEYMPMIASNSLDLYTVAFGIRNFTNKDVALREAFRVLKPGGFFACLEFSKVNPRIPFFEAIYKRWSFGAIPLIGQLVAGDRDSYQYLVESIERFPSQEEFRDMIRAAGFLIPGAGGGDEAIEDEGEGERCAKGWEDLSGGIAAIHKGIKPVQST